MFAFSVGFLPRFGLGLSSFKLMYILLQWWGSCSSHGWDGY